MFIEVDTQRYNFWSYETYKVKNPFDQLANHLICYELLILTHAVKIGCYTVIFQLGTLFFRFILQETPSLSTSLMFYIFLRTKLALHRPLCARFFCYLQSPILWGLGYLYSSALYCIFTSYWCQDFVVCRDIIVLTLRDLRMTWKFMLTTLLL